MSPKPARTATALALLISFAGSYGASAAPPAPTSAVGSAAPAAQPYVHATIAERAAADRLDPLSRSVFWAREFDRDPTDAVAGVELATALRLTGHYAEAADTAGRVIALHPDNRSALLETARAYIAWDRGFYALDPLKKAQAVVPHDWSIYMLQGIAHEQNEQPDEARAAYLQALALSPNNPAVLSNLALWYAKRGDKAQAETLLRTAVAQPSATAQVRQNLALVLGLEGRFDDSERLMRQDLPPQVTDNNLNYLKAIDTPQTR